MRLKSTFINERNEDLFRVLRKIISSPEIYTQKEAIRQAINSPSVRFWVTGECATKAINRIRRGDKLTEMKPHRRKMFFEIYHRYNDQKSKKEFSGKSVSYICSFLVEEPAPAFYLTLSTAIKLYEAHQREKICAK